MSEADQAPPDDKTTFHSDLSRLIRGQFEKHGISYNCLMPLDRLTARYFEMCMRRIQPGPRRVHFSDETQVSLGELSCQGKDDTSARDSLGAVFRLRQLLVDGDNVNGFLSKNIRRAAGFDGLLWRYGMHHFHLGRKTDKDSFVERSGYLLFAIVAPLDAYFVDVRRHPERRGIGWVSQDLLRIVHSNWSKLIEKSVLNGVSGVDLTDEQMQELVRMNCSYAMNIDGRAIAPLLCGTAGDGSSMLCTMRASRLMNKLRDYAEVLRNEEARNAVVQDLRARGIDVGPTLECELALLEDWTLTFAIVDKKTKSPIEMVLKDED